MTKLELNLPEKTIKKLRAYAMLTGSPVSELEAKLVELVDKTLSDSVANALVDLDGGVPAAFTPPTQIETTFSQPLTPADIVTGPLLESEEKEEAVTEDEETGNSLSEEESPEEVKSLEEEAEEEKVDDEELKVEIAAPNAGGNADAYVDAVIAQDKGARQASGRRKVQGGYQSGARKAFDARSPRVSIGAYTGDETDSFNF